MSMENFNFAELKAAANAKQRECISDADGDVCVRPMHFDAEGRREVRYAPDPCDFVSPERAVALVAAL